MSGEPRKARPSPAPSVGLFRTPTARAGLRVYRTISPVGRGGSRLVEVSIHLILTQAHNKLYIGSLSVCLFVCLLAYPKFGTYIDLDL